MQAGVRQHVHVPVEQRFEILTEADYVQKGAVRRHVDQQVDVTRRTVIPSRDGSEDTQIGCAVPLGDSQDLVSLLQEVHGYARRRMAEEWFAP